MIKIAFENKEFQEKEIVGSADVIITDLGCIVDSILEDINIATGGKKNKEELLDLMSNVFKKWWEHERKCKE